jgi:hypothetical protein
MNNLSFLEKKETCAGKEKNEDSNYLTSNSLKDFF